jgi:hypothetical protein
MRLLSVLTIQFTLSLSFLIAASRRDWSVYDDKVCDRTAADQCELDFNTCKNNNPANDSSVNCLCGGIFFGSCIRRANCLFASTPMHSPFTDLTHRVYMSSCIDLIVDNSCPDPSFCYMDCLNQGSSSASLVPSSQPTNFYIFPVNNYMNYFIEVNICNRKYNGNLLRDINQVAVDHCRSDEYTTCPTWIPPSTFVLCKIPQDTTYLSLKYCSVNSTSGSHQCFESSPSPSIIYGNEIKWIESFQTDIVSSCETDGTNMNVISTVLF